MKDKQPPRYGRSAEPTLGARRPNRDGPGRKPGSTSGAKPGSKPRSKPAWNSDKKTGTPNRKTNAGQRDRSHGRDRGADQRGGSSAGKATAGLQSRYLALTIIERVLRDQTSLDMAIPDALADERFAALEPRDKAFARLLAMTVLRHHASLQAVVDTFLQKPLAANAQRMRIILLAGAAELIQLGIAPHATISTAVELTRLSQRTQHFDKLANAVLRRVSERGGEIFKEKDTAAGNIPEWMMEGWRAAYGDDVAARIAEASLQEAPLDLTAKDSPIDWASRLEAIVLPTGTLRRAAGGRIEELDGYDEGGWWVQDAAAALPAKLLGVTPGMRVLDLCAAPGGKTAQLCAAGAEVTAVDVSLTRIKRLKDNLDRLGFHASTIAADAAIWRDVEPFAAVLIDAPCTATGTIRRHPDILHLKRAGDIERLADIQRRLLRNAASLVAVGGTLVYCTCSLEPAEGEERIAQFLEDPGSTRLRFARQPIAAPEIGGQATWLTPAGDLRTMPFHMSAEQPALAGIDGFYAARLKRLA
ncbi:MAG: RsmB/NOP family class I SAM-dependent RNA methyltransferase [Hyphomicrobiaceae bacterium]